MIIYQSNVKGFSQEIDSGRIASVLENEILIKMNRKTSNSEFRSWENSLIHLNQVLNSAQIDQNIGVAIEYNLPRSSKRIDVVLSGFGIGGKKIILIIELKQWERAQKVNDQDMVVKTFLAKSNRETVHPSYQAYSYGVFLREFSEVVYLDENIEIKTCGFLHNYDIEKYPEINDDQYQKYITDSPLFYKTDKVKFREYIKDLFISGDNGALISQIESGSIRPGKSVQVLLRDAIEDKDTFTLVDEQKVVFEKTLALLRKSINDKQKRVVIIPGGPGTGKTLIALRLLARTMIRYRMNAIYVSKNESLRNIYKKIILEDNLDKKYTNAIVESMFFGSGSFKNLVKDQYDFTVIDESQRLMERGQWDKKDAGYQNQIREIICESKVSVFFIDEKQRVTFKDIGSVEEIKTQAIKEGVSPENVILLEPLVSQFRSSGADQFIALVDNLLYGEYQIDLEFKNNFDLKIFDDPQEMFDAIYQKNKQGNSARVLAGYCWNWVSKNDNSKFDIEIGNFKKQWNLSSDKHYMIGSDSIEQIGCIHTSQGLESDYIGVIIGDDLRFENDALKTDYTARARTDKSLTGIKKLGEPQTSLIADELIKNTYRVLLTRAMKGCYIYCTDQNLRKWLKSKIND